MSMAVLEGECRHSLTEFLFVTDSNYDVALKFFIEAGKKIDREFFLMIAVEDLPDDLCAGIEEAGFVVAENHPLRHPVFDPLLKGTYLYIGLKYERAPELIGILDDAGVSRLYCFYNIGIDYDSSMYVTKTIQTGIPL